MQEIGKIVMILGIIIAIIGGILTLSDKTPFIGKLPGDILIKRGNFTFYAPIATSILFSIIISALFFILGNFKK
jgi:hypothetical protein